MGTLSLDDYEDVRIWAPWGHIAGRWYGNRTERPILAIHGWLDNLGTFDTLIHLLPDYLGILCIDLPGHGCSARLPPGMQYGYDIWVLVIARIMKEYTWAKVSLMGHSLGGILSFFYTSFAPDLVDLVISLDIVLPHFECPGGLSAWNFFTEKCLVEDERNEQKPEYEPPSYMLPQLRSLLNEGTENSVTLEFTQHLLHRSITKSPLYPDKFYFTKDGRTKWYYPFVLNPTLAAEMARRIKRNPYLVIKASESEHIDSKSNEVISILGQQNPHFEYHEVPGSHHVHLVNAEACAQHIVPFLRRHRPPTVVSWSLAGEETTLGRRAMGRTKKGFLKRNKRSKL